LARFWHFSQDGFKDGFEGILVAMSAMFVACGPYPFPAGLMN
jgi:hypothetical protein